MELHSSLDTLFAMKIVYLACFHSKGDTWEGADSFLSELELVERVQVKLGHQVKTWHLNFQKKTKKTLNEMGIEDLFVEKTEVECNKFFF